MNGWQNALEGKFKFEHARVRMCSESIAFFGGERRERELLNKRWVRGEGLGKAHQGAARCGLSERWGAVRCGERGERCAYGGCGVVCQRGGVR
jgi:hypothetical protein